MWKRFPKPAKEEIIHEDKKLCVLLARYPIVRGHAIVVWKKEIPDLHLLSKKDYKHLMNAVDNARNALLKTLNVKKVYLIYMDEARHVHWHLVPRYNEKGYDILKHKPSKLKDFSLAGEIRKNLK